MAPSLGEPTVPQKAANVEYSESEYEKGQEANRCFVSSDSPETQATDADSVQGDSKPEPLIVDWDGPDDPENPRNWSTKRKWAAALTVSAFTFISPVSSSMVAPAANQIAAEFHITSSVEVALTISVFVLAYAVGPLFLGPLSEMYGRTIILRSSNLWFMAWNLGCGFAQNEGQLIAFRFLAGIGGSAPLATGGAVLSDMWTPDQRGQAIAIYSLAPLLGPVIGPVAGGWIAQLSTWRWVFRSTSIAAAVVQAFGYFFLKETHAPVLLQHKARKIRKQLDVEKGPRTVRTIFQTNDRHWKRLFAKAIFRPFILFAHEPIIQLLGIYLAFVYGTVYLVLTTIPDIFQYTYHEKVGVAGLQYISLGIGLSLASQVNARMLDLVYSRLKKRNGGVGLPEFRLPNVMPGTLFLPIGLLIAGWGAEKHVHWIVPDIGFAFVGAGIILTFQGIQTYVIDAFTAHAASALAAVSCLRSLAGFGFPLFAPAMYSDLGYGVGNTILAAFAFAVGCPAIWLFWIYGARIRGASRHARKEEKPIGSNSPST